MEITYIVQTCDIQEVTVKASVNGKEVDAKVPGLVVQMVSEDGSMGHTFRFMPDDLEAAKAEFPIGSKMTASFAPVLTPAE